MSDHAYQMLEWAPRVASSPMDRLDPTTPTVRCRPRPESAVVGTRLASCEPFMTPNASGQMLSPAPSALKPRVSWSKRKGVQRTEERHRLEAMTPLQE